MRIIQPALFALLFLLLSCHNYQKDGGHLAVEARPETTYGDLEPMMEDQEIPSFNTEEYDYLPENEFRNALDHPLSTFSIDVDHASYSNMRRFLMHGQLPPADAVRIEELINYFSYDYPAPADEQPFSIATELAACPWAPDHQLLHIGLKGREIPREELPPSNLVFLLDVSGSMNDPNKLPLLKSAFKLLVDQLREQDRVAIAVYAGSSGLALSSTPGNQKQVILAALDQLQAGGSTAGAEGIDLAYRVAGEHFLPNGNNRVILATDGDFNVGPSSDGELTRLIEKKREQGIFLSVLGFGMGNYKDSKMEKLADHGNGHYAYIDNLTEARKVLVSEMAGTLHTIAKDVKIQIEFNPVRVREYRLIGYENRLLNAEDFNDDRKDAGDIGAGHTVTALYELVPAGSDGPAAGKIDPLKYQRQQLSDRAHGSTDWLTIKLRYKAPQAGSSELISRIVAEEDRLTGKTSENFRFAAAVASFGMLLRNSSFKGDSSFDEVLTLARGAKGSDPHGYRREFIELVELAQSLASSTTAKTN